MTATRRDTIDAMEAAADIGAFELVEDIRRRLDLKICTICRGSCSYESAWRAMWRSTLIHICEPCTRHCTAGYSHDVSYPAFPNIVCSIRYKGQRFTP